MKRNRINNSNMLGENVYNNQKLLSRKYCKYEKNI